MHIEESKEVWSWCAGDPDGSRTIGVKIVLSIGEMKKFKSNLGDLDPACMNRETKELYYLLAQIGMGTVHE